MEIIHLEPSNSEPPDKKLSARTQRRKANKNTNEFVIKCGLANSLKIDQIYKDAFCKEVHKRMIQASQASHRVGLLMNIFFRKCIQRTSKPWEIEISKEVFKNSTFVYQLITGVDNARKEIPEVIELLNDYSHMVSAHKIVRCTGDTNSLMTVASQYVTTLKTYLQENFERVQMQFLITWCAKKDFDAKFIKQIRYKINGWELKNEDLRDARMERLIFFHRKLLGLGDTEYICKSWMKDNYDKMIIYFSILSKFLVRNNKKSVLVAPLPQIKSSFLYIDNNVLYGILRDIKYITKKIDYDASMYYDIFKINKLLTTRQKQDGFIFTGTIQTDCASINFHFRRPNPSASGPKREYDRNDPNVRVIAQDPGRVNLFYGVEELEDGTFKKFKLSRNHFYTSSGAKQAVKKNNKWNTELEDLKLVLDQLSQTNSRSNNLNEFLDYVKVVKSNEDLLWGEYTKQRHARQRFALYSGKKKTYDKFFSSIASYGDPEKKIVIAYGDAGFKSSAKYELAAPTTTLEKQCSKWFNVVKVDEFRTTQLHYETGTILAKVVEAITTVNTLTNTKTKSIRSIRGLLWYISSTNCCKFIDRDFNAAKNILRCYRVFPNRPLGMDRNDPRQENPPAHYIKKRNTYRDCLGIKLVRD